MAGIQALQLRKPQRCETRFLGRREAGALKFVEQSLCGFVREAKIAGDKLLIENGRAEKAGKLLLFRRVARKSQNVTQARKNCAGDPTLVRLEKSDLAFAERENHVGMMKFDAIFRGNCVHGLWIEAKQV